jgi:hypothetical protein
MEEYKVEAAAYSVEMVSFAEVEALEEVVTASSSGR